MQRVERVMMSDRQPGEAARGVDSATVERFDEAGDPVDDDEEERPR